MPPASEQGLDGRQRDEDGRIRAKNGSTLVSSLRETYGDGFAAGVRPDMHLSTLLERTGMASLSQYIEAGMPEVPPAKKS
jgi:hypothetical protein